MLFKTAKPLFVGSIPIAASNNSNKYNDLRIQDYTHDAFTFSRDYRPMSHSSHWIYSPGGWTCIPLNTYLWGVTAHSGETNTRRKTRSPTSKSALAR
jgi:hypothetical protein